LINNDKVSVPVHVIKQHGVVAWLALAAFIVLACKKIFCLFDISKVSTIL